MTTKATLAQLFGTGSSQDTGSITFAISPGLTAEGILVELLARLLSYQGFGLYTESGASLQAETGQTLSGAIAFTLIEAELYSTRFAQGYRIDKIFLGFNEDI